MRQWWSKIAQMFGGRRQIASELDQELEAHLQLVIDDHIERGLTPEDARRAAVRSFGNRRTLRERGYETWQFPRVESLLQDIRYALRGMARTPGFTLVVMLTLALGIGANTTIFSAVYSVLLKRLPYPASERLVVLGESSAKATGISVTWLNFKQWQRENHTFEAMAGYQSADLTLTGRGQATLTYAGVVTSEFFPLTGARPILGRLFTAADDDPHAPATVVVTESFWAKVLGSNPRIVGSVLTLDGRAVTVIGVLARDPGFFLRAPDYYLPLRPTAAQLSRRDAHGSMRVLALLRPGVTLDDARADLDTILQRLAKADPGPETDHRGEVEWLTEKTTGDARTPLLLLMASVGLVLVLACANIASLMLIRATTRAREMAIRAAIGAGRRRLVRQLLTEAMVMSLAGGAAGIALAGLSLRALTVFGPRDVPRLSEAGLSVPVLLFAAGLTILVGLVCSVAPVLTLRKVSLSLLLKEGAAGSGSSGMGHVLRGGLVVAEIAVTVVLLFASGTLLRSLWRAETANPGFDPADVLALELQLPRARYASDGAILDFYSRLETRMRALPGVLSAGAVNCPPGAGDCGDWWYSVVERPAPGRNDVPVTLTNTADATYFDTMRIPIVAGRSPSPEDRAGAPSVVVINETIARTWWNDPHAAVGQHIKLGGPYMQGPVLEIVGVAANVPQMGLDTDPVPQLYLPAAQHVDGGMVVTLRTRGKPASLAPAVRSTLAGIDANVPIQSLKTCDEWLGATLEQRRFLTLLLMIFAAMAVLLAAIGCFGVMNFWVSSRRQEIAIRMAMGASTLAILHRTGRQAAWLGAAGMAIGLACSWGAARWLRSLVFGISTHDPLVLGAAAAMAVLILMVSAAVPMWRASRVNATETLHEI